MGRVDIRKYFLTCQTVLNKNIQINQIKFLIKI